MNDRIRINGVLYESVENPGIKDSASGWSKDLKEIIDSYMDLRHKIVVAEQNLKDVTSSDKKEIGKFNGLVVKIQSAMYELEKAIKNL